MATQSIRLTEMAHGGGCGCKLAPRFSRKFWRRCRCRRRRASAGGHRNRATTLPFTGSTSVKLSSRQRISSCQWSTIRSISAASRPRMLCRMSTPWAERPSWRSPWWACRWIRCRWMSCRIFSPGGASVCTAAGIPVAGGHSIDSPEPIYGLVAIGLVEPSRVMRNNTARAGDKIILTKRLGVGIYSAALKRQELDAPLYEEMVRSMTQLECRRRGDGGHGRRARDDRRHGISACWGTCSKCAGALPSVQNCRLKHCRC